MTTTKLNPQTFKKTLESNDVDFFVGVPDSLLADFCAVVQDEVPAERHLIAANEGAAVGLALGHYLATGRLGAVYMQNSGTGNAVNPLLSLAAPQCYAVPMLLIVGWRGQPGVKDEPQHKQQGAVQEALFKAMEIPYVVLSLDEAEAAEQVKSAVAEARKLSSPYALLVRKDTFQKYSLKQKTEKKFQLTREKAVELLIGEVCCCCCCC
jgi:phosphonopyruvate decarboxylase